MLALLVDVSDVLLASANVRLVYQFPCVDSGRAADAVLACEVMQSSHSESHAVCWRARKALAASGGSRLSALASKTRCDYI